MQRSEADRQCLRLMRFLAGGTATAAPAAEGGSILLDGGERGAIVVPAGVLRGLLAEGRLVREGSTVTLPGPDPALRRRDLGSKTIADGESHVEVAVNLAESPLALLMRRRTADGGAFLSEREFDAGERLRADYTRGRIMPRLGANWEASVSSGRRSGGVADLTEAALAARLRVERAIGAVGPELAGVLIDVCCFLKGMETVEAERGWPVRSAKVVLKTALGALARHYEPPARGRGPKVLHWGAEGYRPAIG